MVLKEGRKTENIVYKDVLLRLLIWIFCCTLEFLLHSGIFTLWNFFDNEKF